MMGQLSRVVHGKVPHIMVNETAEAIELETMLLKARVRKTGYVSGIEGGSFTDKITGFHDAGFGLAIVDFLLEPGWSEIPDDQLPPALRYSRDLKLHGNRGKHIVEGPQICTRAGKLEPRIIRGDGFVAIQQDFRYTVAAGSRKAGSLWEQTILIPADTRYVLVADKVTSSDDSHELFLRTDLPGHIRHRNGDSFSQVYLSYYGLICSSQFLSDFGPHERFGYVRTDGKIPTRFIRAYRLRDPKTGQEGPWLAGMTLDPTSVYEAWCHQRGYVCMIQEIGGRPIRAGQSFGAAYIIGFFDEIEQMERVYDRYSPAGGIRVTSAGWKLLPGPD